MEINRAAKIIEPSAAENIRFLFQRNSLLTTQFISDRITKTLAPEKRLMLAILEDALYCFQDNCSAQHGKRKQLYDDVQRWFLDTSDDRVFSFNNICSALGFDPDYIRKGLLQWREKQLSKRHRTAA